jgi:uncharacterized membrane protein
MTRVSLAAAATLLGLSAGLFATFSYVVMPGLRRIGDATFVQSMRAINVAILNPVFAVVFGGAALVTVAALIGAWATDARPWLLAAFVLYVLGAFVLTGAVNVPLNDALEAGTGPAAELRSAFEDTWVAVNHARSALTVAAFVCAVVATMRA